jgi:hypothetical protein
MTPVGDFLSSILFLLRLSIMNKYSVRNVALLGLASAAVAIAFFGLSSWLVQSYVRGLNSYYGPNSSAPYPPSEIAGGDAILLIIGGAIFLLGSGGISRNTSRAALYASVASAFGNETVGPAEMMRRDAWRPKGHKLMGLTLIAAGIFSIVLAFLLAYIPL